MIDKKLTNLDGKIFNQFMDQIKEKYEIEENEEKEEEQELHVKKTPMLIQKDYNLTITLESISK